MNCPGCGHENPDGAHFCGACGTSLAPRAACPACGEDNPAGQKFCNACGGPLTETPSEEPEPRAYVPEHVAARAEASAGALEGEHKQVTVLFADVQGSMDLASSIDAEAWHSVMDGFYGLVCDEVHRFEGTVNKFTGDGAMALFGAPVAHEDHAGRACYAALHVRDRLHEYAAQVRREHGLSFSVRMGLNSGEVVVGAMGSDRDLEFTAIGNTVGLAARMEALAEPGKPCLTASTAALVEGYFEVEDLGEARVKGLDEPVRTYALVGVGDARTRLDASRSRGLSRFVGREEELAALEAALEGADRTGQVVGVVGEPGMGKSRVCTEFAESCRARGVQVTEGRGLAHGRRIPLLPVIEMMRAYFDIGEQDDARQARAKIAGRLLLLDDAFRDALPVVFDFLGVPDAADPPPPQMSPEARQRALFGAVRHLVEARAGEGPGVLLIEDLHWLDPSSEAFLENLVDALPGSRTLVIVNFRPEYRGAWTQKSYYRQLPLSALGPVAIAELTRDLLGDDPSLDGLDELLADRTGGNPFFVEEVVQGLVDSGALSGEHGGYRLTRSVEELAIPATVQSVLAARIDRLPEAQKAVLQCASVIGREFTEPVLRAVTGLPEHELSVTLAALREVELVFEKTLYPEAEYAFKHALTEEVAYRAQLGDRRAHTHAAVAAAIEELYPDRLEELAGLVANHWEQAREPAQAARWSARAATWAGQHHPVDALRHWRRTRDLLAGDPSEQGLRLTACLWLLQLGWRFGLEREEVEGVFEEARELAGEDKSSTALVFLAHGIASGMAGDIARAQELLEQCRKLAEEAENREIALCSGVSFWLWLEGETPAAAAEMEDYLPRYDEDAAIGREIVGFSPYAWVMMFLGSVVLPELGRIEEGRRLRDRAIEVATEHGDVEVLGWVESNFVWGAAASGELEDSFDHVRRGMEIAERLGSGFSRIQGYFQMAFMHGLRGEWHESEAWALRARELLESARTGIPMLGLIRTSQAEAALGLGKLDEAREVAAAAIEDSVRLRTRGFEGAARRTMGRILLAGGEPAAARPELERALALFRTAGLRPREALAHETLAELAGAEGDPALREAELREALRMHRENGATGHERRLLAELQAGAPTVG